MDLGLLTRVEAQLVRQEWAERVVSPAYDALRPEQRFDVMKKDPYVFLHVTRSFGDDESEKTAEKFPLLMLQLYLAFYQRIFMAKFVAHRFTYTNFNLEITSRQQLLVMFHLLLSKKDELSPMNGYDQAARCI